MLASSKERFYPDGSTFRPDRDQPRGEVLMIRGASVGRGYPRPRALLRYRSRSPTQRSGPGSIGTPDVTTHNLAADPAFPTVSPGGKR